MAKVYYDLKKEDAADDVKVTLDESKRKDVSIALYTTHRDLTKLRSRLLSLTPESYSAANIQSASGSKELDALFKSDQPPHVLVLPSTVSEEESARIFQMLHALPERLKPAIFLIWDVPARHPFIQYILQHAGGGKAYNQLFDYNPLFFADQLSSKSEFSTLLRHIEHVIAYQFREFARSEVRMDDNYQRSQKDEKPSRSELRQVLKEGVILRFKNGVASTAVSLLLVAQTIIAAGDLGIVEAEARAAIFETRSDANNYDPIRLARSVGQAKEDLLHYLSDPGRASQGPISIAIRMNIKSTDSFFTYLMQALHAYSHPVQLIAEKDFFNALPPSDSREPFIKSPIVESQWRKGLTLFSEQEEVPVANDESTGNGILSDMFTAFSLDLKGVNVNDVQTRDLANGGRDRALKGTQQHDLGSNVHALLTSKRCCRQTNLV